MDVSGKIAINFFLIAIVMHIHLTLAECPATVYRDVKGFGPDCKYRCNCVNNEQCDEVNGHCQSGCKHGWMGPACQYRNYATAPTVATAVRHHYPSQQQSDWAPKAIDGNLNTCSKTGIDTGQPTQQWWRAVYESEMYIVGLVIKIPERELAKFRGFSIEIGNATTGGSYNYDICYKHGNDEDGKVAMDVNCVQPLVGNVVRIKLAEGVSPPLTLCEVEIYGGRLISFNKPTSLKTVLEYEANSFWNSSFAVDGRQMRFGENQNSGSIRTCAATKQTAAQHWFNVNLEAVFSIQGISLFGRLEQIDQYRGYSVLVDASNTQDFQNMFTDVPSDDVNDYNPKSNNFTVPILGSIVRVQRSGIILVLCEFEVFGECPLGKCGFECNITCMCSSQTTGLHKLEGTCPYGCSGRWTGADGKCDIECSGTEWGSSCRNTCGNCRDNTSCSVSDGTCPNSCRPGWNPPLCVDQCSDGYFGQDCNFTCGECKDDVACNKEDGVCSTGCKLGYNPPHCIDKCDSGSYGDNCRKSCGKCLNDEACHHMTGICPDGCYIGYQLPTCELPCNAGTYGVNCSGNCGSCKNEEACNATTGKCSSGCSSGWLTELCDKPCKSGFYGGNCSDTCGNCLANSPCNNENGACSGCSVGYHGSLCKLECDGGRFGENCDSVCGNCAGSSPCNRTNGACPLGCASGYKGELCDVEDGNSTGIVVGVVIGVLLLLAAALVAVVVYKRKTKEHAKPKPENGAMTFTNPEIKVTTDAQRTERIPSIAEEALYYNEGNEQTTDKTAIKISCLRAYSHVALKNPTSLYDDFQDLPYGLTNDASEARAVQYRPKNRYKDMYPYNMNRVVLPEFQGDPDSTYINASYIDGYETQRKYIAAQGALETTVQDIWRMVWSEQVSVIVMLTNCYELGRLKCMQYWSDEGSAVYANICTEITSVEEYTDFKIRTFVCTQIDSGEKRTVLQFHYTAWPDKDVPDTALSLVQFWRKVRGHVEARSVPWMVHCSAGVGRTGTFIALDYLYDQGKSEGEVKVKDCVLTLRQQRLNMVQTKHQYVYLHEAIAEALDPIGTVCGSERFAKLYSTLFTKDGVPAPTLREEYDVLCEDNETGDAIYCNDNTSAKGIADANLHENLEKSRNLTIVPDNLHRPRLGMAVQGRNDFINAVFVPTYRDKDRLILTQWPLSNTTIDFVRMVWEFGIDTVVLLDESVPVEGVYWPSKEVPKIIRPFTAEHVAEEKEEYYIIRTVRYTMGDSSKEVRIYQFQSWPSNKSTPVNTASMLRLISDIENERRDKTPLVVQCLDGAEKSGLFCVLCCVLERMKTDREIAIAETIRQIRVRRKQVINNFEQYAYCYRTVQDYLECHEVYANVM